MSIDHYTYELKKSRMLGSFLGNKVAIREEWVKRTRRYVVASGLDLSKLATFVKKGLYDRRMDGFNEMALEEPLSEAQRWTLMWLILKEFGVPEWLQDPDKDELAPEMVVAEPEEEPDSVVEAILSPATTVAGAILSPATTVAGATAAATTTAATATLDAGKAVTGAALSVAAIPVKTLSSLVTSSVEEEAEEAIAEAEEAIAEAEVETDAPEDAPDAVEDIINIEEDAEADAPEDAEVVQSGE
jgi:hypothetical protein